MAKPCFQLLLFVVAAFTSFESVVCDADSTGEVGWNFFYNAQPDNNAAYNVISTNSNSTCEEACTKDKQCAGYSMKSNGCTLFSSTSSNTTFAVNTYFAEKILLPSCGASLLRDLPTPAFGNLNVNNQNNPVCIKQGCWKGKGDFGGVVINLGKLYEISRIDVEKGDLPFTATELTLSYSVDGVSFNSMKIKGPSTVKAERFINVLDQPLHGSVIKVSTTRAKMQGGQAPSFGLKVFGCNITIPTEPPTLAPTTPGVQAAPPRSSGSCSLRNSKQAAGFAVSFDSSGSQISALPGQTDFAKKLFKYLARSSVFCSRNMEMRFMSVGKGGNSNDSLVLTTKQYSSGLEFKMAEYTRLATYQQNLLKSTPEGMTDLGGVVDYTTDRVVFSLPSNAKKFLFLVSDFIVTENKDQLTDAIAKAKSASWTVIPVLLKMDGVNKFGENIFKQVGGDKGINLQEKSLSRGLIGSVLKENGF